MDSERWYRDGLRFACTRCGNCCTGRGTVRVSDEEIAALSRRLGLSDEVFRGIYTRGLRDGGVSLPETGALDCVLYDRERGCTVYSDRPRQCRTWPFWRGVVHLRERWSEEAEDCPGMNRRPLHGAEWIAITSAADGTSGWLPEPAAAGETGSSRRAGGCRVRREAHGDGPSR